MQFGDALFAYLTDTLTSESHLSSNLLETTLLTTDAKALLDNLKLAVLKYVAKNIIEIGSKRLVINKLIKTTKKLAKKMGLR